MHKTVLITGGSGFLGRQIVKYAENAGYKVLAPRSSELDLLNWDGSTSYFDEHPNIDVIIHSAAYYGGIGINKNEPATIFYRNIQMAINVFEMARVAGVKKILPIGSACAYPGSIHGDLKEDDFWNGELHDSVEAYGFSKKVQLVGQNAYYKQYGIESNHLILTNLYGPNDVFTEYRSHVVSALIKKFTDSKEKVKLWGDGSPIREFLYVEDAAEAIVKAIELPHSTEPVNIGTGRGTTIRELAELIEKITDFSGELEWDTDMPNGVARKVLDINRMKSQLDWEPKYSLEDGLKKTIQWYVANKEMADQRQ